MTSMNEFSYFLKFLYVFFVILVPFEILSHYINVDISRGLREDGQWIIDKIFNEKLMV